MLMDPKPLPNLKVRKSVALQKLTERIEKGKEVLSINILDEESLNSAKHQFGNWQRLNYDILSQIFDDSSIADDYIARLGGVIGMSAPLESRISQFDTDFKDDINKLESIKERVDFMPITTRAVENKTRKDEAVQKPFSKNTIKNLVTSRSIHKKPWYEQWWGVIIIGVIIFVLGTIVTKYLGLIK